MATASIAGVLGVLCSQAGCSSYQLGLPRVAAARQSPDGHYRAIVRNHPSIDPPEQSLWLGADDGSDAEQILKLSGDQDVQRHRMGC